ncbi:hypothetical protein O3P69_018520 [Scylla paramamosain]|uniref:Uncharacterized protein n=1 Tax=Scylla paramamosain TaxID=85552 RepID=A0AAW0T1Q5_SCYPA
MHSGFNRQDAVPHHLCEDKFIAVVEAAVYCCGGVVELLSEARRIVGVTSLYRFPSHPSLERAQLSGSFHRFLSI